MFRENPSGCMLTRLFPAAPRPLSAGAGLKGSLLHPIKLTQSRIQGQLRLHLAPGQTRLPHGAPGWPGCSLPAAAWQEGAPGRLRKQSEKPTLLEKPSAVLGRV